MKLTTFGVWSTAFLVLILIPESRFVQVPVGAKFSLGASSPRNYVLFVKDLNRLSKIGGYAMLLFHQFLLQVLSTFGSQHIHLVLVNNASQRILQFVPPVPSCRPLGEEHLTDPKRVPVGVFV